jgi:DNA polymerase I-like protein with 3'-5' exonuclease and polymerase domains
MMAAVAQWGSPAAIYAIDKVTAECCTSMSRNGFGFDRERAAAFASYLEIAIAEASMAINATVGRPVKPLSPRDLGAAFFGDLKAPVYFRSKLTGRPSLGVDAMRGYAASQRPELSRAALAVLNYRRLRKVRSTYLLRAMALAEESRDHRVHPGWLNYGAVSGRWSCQDPNLANLPRSSNDPTWAAGKAGLLPEGGIRGLYTAREGYTLVTFDASQLEMRVAAYSSGDAAMINACEQADLHRANAWAIWGAAFEAAAAAQQDELRQLAKSAGFAVCYMAEATTVFARIVAEGKVAISLPQVEAMLQKLRRGFKGYFAWQEAMLKEAIRTGYAREWVTGRRRWVGHDPSPAECANHPIQGGAAGILNTRLPIIAARVAQECGGGGGGSVARSNLVAQLVASVYDSGVFEVPESKAEQCVAICREVFEAPVRLQSSGLEGRFPIDVKIGPRWK